MTLRVAELFAGIGAQRMALTLSGIPHEVVGISEIDRHALASYKAIWGDCPNLGDVREIGSLPPCDLVTYSFPCQDLSLAGKRKGMAEGAGTRSGLVWEVVRLLESAGERERPEWLLMENVPQVLTAPEWPSLTGRLEAMGYRNKWAKLDSSAFGSAQKRVRAFMVSRLGAEPPDLPLCSPGAPALCLRDIMEETRGERHIRRIPLDRIRWREPKEGYSHPQSEGIQAPLIDAACPRLEDRRIMAEASLSPALRASGKTTVVEEEEEEERVKPLVGRADTLRMAGPGRIATLGKPPSTPAASIDGETFYTKAVIYSPLRSAPTVRCQGRHGLSNQIKVFACDDGSGALDQSIVPSRTFLDRRYYDDSGSAPCVVSSTQGRIKVVADMERPSHLDYQNRLYSSSSSSPAVIAHGGSDHEIKVAAGIEGRLKAVPPMAEGDVCPIQTPQRAKKGQNGSGIRPPNSPAYTVTTEPDGGAEISGGDLVVNILTPLECWRLMGFPYWAFRRASAVCSETQLYNQAGNSIVVEVLEAIFRAMFPPKPRRVQATLEEAGA